MSCPGRRQIDREGDARLVPPAVVTVTAARHRPLPVTSSTKLAVSDVCCPRHVVTVTPPPLTATVVARDDEVGAGQSDRHRGARRSLIRRDARQRRRRRGRRRLRCHGRRRHDRVNRRDGRGRDAARSRSRRDTRALVDRRRQRCAAASSCSVIARPPPRRRSTRQRRGRCQLGRRRPAVAPCQTNAAVWFNECTRWRAMS